MTGIVQVDLRPHRTSRRDAVVRPDAGPGGWHWDPLQGLLAAMLATAGFIVTLLLIFAGSSPTEVLIAAFIAVGSFLAEVYLLSRLP